MNNNYKIHIQDCTIKDTSVYGIRALVVQRFKKCLKIPKKYSEAVNDQNKKDQRTNNDL